MSSATPRVERFGQFARWAEVFRRELFPSHAVNLSALTRGMLSDGAGVRHGLFVQGCLRYCAGCKNRREAKPKVGRMVPPGELARELARVRRMRLRTAVYGGAVAQEKALRLAAAYQCLVELGRKPILAAHIGETSAATYARAIRWLTAVCLGLSRARALDRAPADLAEVDVSGVTLSGGEPALQVPALTTTVRELRTQWPEVDVWLYTSFAWSELAEHAELRGLVEQVDVVKSGAFDWRQRGGGLYYGSANQCLLDARTSLGTGTPVPLRQTALATTLELAIAEISGAPHRLAGEVVAAVVDRLDEPPGQTERIEELEAWLGPVDATFPARLFVPVPAARGRGFGFLAPRQLNLHALRVAPLAPWSTPVIEVRLQGSRIRPATHARPSVTFLRPRELLEPAELFARVATERWTFRTALVDDDAAALRTALALVHHALSRQLDYWLLDSPLPALSLADYAARAKSLIHWIEGLFVVGGSGWPVGPGVISIRGGDPALQVDGVRALIDEAHRRGLRVHLELPHGWSVVQSRAALQQLAAAADLITCGPPARREPPPTHPLLSSSAQEVRAGSNGALWKPTTMDEDQLALFLARFGAPGQLRQLRLACLAETEAWDVAPPTYELLLARIGDPKREAPAG